MDRSMLSPRFVSSLVLAIWLLSACTGDSGRASTTLGSDDPSEGPAFHGAESLEKLAESLDLVDPPQDVAFERYISPDEYAEVMVPCLTDQGIPASPLPDGGVGYGEIAPDQAQSQAEALYRCLVRFPTHPRYSQPLDSDQLRLLYEYKVEELVECLEAEEYSVVTPPPSLEVYIASYYDPSVETWDPYWALRDDPRLNKPEEWFRLNSVCPQSPPTDVLYGEP